MTITLAEITKRVSRLINRHASGAATALGLTTTLIDTVGLAGYPDDHFNEGTLWLTSGANAGRSRAITDFVTGTGTLTTAAFPNANASGVTWEACDSNFVTYQDLRQAVNLGLQESGKIIGDPDETLATVADQWIYDLPDGIYDIGWIEIVTNPGDADEEMYKASHWEELHGQIRFDQGFHPDIDKFIRIYPRIFHPDLVNDTDEVDSQIDSQSLVYLAARQAMRMAYKKAGKAGSETIPEWLNEAAEEAKKQMRRNRNNPIVKVRTG